MKKTYLVITALLLVLMLVFVGCNKEDKTDKTDKTEQNSTTTTTVTVTNTSYNGENQAKNDQTEKPKDKDTLEYGAAVGDVGIPKINWND